MGHYCKDAKGIRTLKNHEVVNGQVHDPQYGGEHRWIVSATDPAVGHDKVALCFTNRVVIIALPFHMRKSYANGNETVRAVFHEDFRVRDQKWRDVFVLPGKPDGQNILRLCDLPHGTQMKVLQAGAAIDPVKLRVRKPLVVVQSNLSTPAVIPKAKPGPVTVSDVIAAGAESSAMTRYAGAAILTLFVMIMAGFACNII